MFVLNYIFLKNSDRMYMIIAVLHAVIVNIKIQKSTRLTNLNRMSQK